MAEENSWSPKLKLKMDLHVGMKNIVFWDVMPRGLVRIDVSEDLSSPSSG
jgi:hypothetical protein